MQTNITRYEGQRPTLDNYYQPLINDYPLAMQELSKWYEAYRKEAESMIALPPKLHDLPIAIQAGILQAYVEHNDWGIHVTPGLWAYSMDGLFNELPNRLFYREQDLREDQGEQNAEQ